MPNVRPISEKKYGISKNAFGTAYRYCLQYPEWKAELRDRKRKTGVKSPHITGMPGAHGSRSQVEQQALDNVELERKIEKVEETVREAAGEDEGLYSYLLLYVTTEGATFHWIKSKGIPCERTRFYELRRKFYYLMARKI